MGKELDLSISNIAFMVLIFGAIIAGILGEAEVFVIGATSVMILVIAGLVVGLINIDKSESVIFIVAVIALGLSSGGLAILPIVGGYVEAILFSLGIGVSSAVIPVAVKAIYDSTS